MHTRFLRKIPLCSRNKVSFSLIIEKVDNSISMLFIGCYCCARNLRSADKYRCEKKQISEKTAKKKARMRSPWTLNSHWHTNGFFLLDILWSQKAVASLSDNAINLFENTKKESSFTTMIAYR